MADIFVSYTSSDRDWAFWIGQELLKLGHEAHIHEWEISGGGDIMAWMDERHDAADHVLCVISKTYLTKSYSGWERRAAQWAVQTDHPNFVLPVFIENCQAPNLLAHFKRCDLYGVTEEDAQKLLRAFLAPASRPEGPVRFPGRPADARLPTAGSDAARFPGRRHALTNVPITVPLHFLGRDEDLTTIDAALKKGAGGRAAITTALHGLRGVGKSTLAAAYAERHRDDYRATWWIRAETESTMRADLAGLGVRLGWVAADEKEEPALAAVMERLRDAGEGILLTYDNANNQDEIRKYLPRGGAAHVIVTSNAPNWRGIAAPVEIEVWPREIGADYLIAGTGRDREREAALALSGVLEGLPLAHAQAAAYCDRLGVSLAEYHKRFEATPDTLLDDQRDAAADYHGGRTVAKTFALAIDEAAILHPAAESLIVYAALLAPEPIPLFLFSEAREKFGEPFALNLAGDGLDEAVAALRAFALLDRESIPDEREPSIATDCIRLHRLVREVAASRYEPEGRKRARRILIEVLESVAPEYVWRDSDTWPRVRRLDPFTLALVGGDAVLPGDGEDSAAVLLDRAASYRHFALAAYGQAKPFYERALAIREGLFGPEHPKAAASLNNLGYLLLEQGDYAGARSHFERALTIDEKALGPDHPDTGTDLNNLGNLLEAQGDLAGARRYCERALAICEKALGPDHPATASSLNNVAYLLVQQGDLAGARPHYERALAVREKALGPDHLHTAESLNNLALLLHAQGDLAGARPHCERALAICEKTLGAGHPRTRVAANNTATLLEELKYGNEAKALREKFGVEN